MRRARAASACGERRGLRDTRVSGRASGRATVEEVPFDEGGFWLDLADLARAAKDRRGGEMRGENYRSTGGVRVPNSVVPTGRSWLSERSAFSCVRGVSNFYKKTNSTSRIRSNYVTA